MRYNPLQEDRQEKTRSLEIPSKLDIDRRLFSSKVTEVDRGSKIEVEKELDEVRESRATPLTKRWNPAEKMAERSQSAHPIGRLRLADDCWVVERPASRLEEERERRVQELETVKQARTDYLSGPESVEEERPSSR